MKYLILLALLFFCFSSLFTQGIQPTGSGTQGDPYQIANLGNLEWISIDTTSWDAHFIQTADIDASDTQNWNGGEGFNTIGINIDFSSHGTPFSGCYNGQNHSIDSLFISRPGIGGQGLFGSIFQATIENLGVVNADVNGLVGVGCLAGGSVFSTITNCFSIGSASGGWQIGGLVGYSAGSNVINCYSDCNVNNNNGDTTGGLIGSNDQSEVHNCYSTGNVNGLRNVGGLIGFSGYTATVTNSYSTGDVNGISSVGGFAGVNAYGSTINTCHSTGNVNGGGETGGLVGRNINLSTIFSCFSTGNVIGSNRIGGLAGTNDYSSITDCYSSGNASGNSA
ncbi:MAG: hypothetical protein K8S56_01280, partial [Candidatus Cloacimonetes bacterium]|nr:hypothetical protein [Candidatus Cloacimonadota bacterium]